MRTLRTLNLHDVINFRQTVVQQAGSQIQGLLLALRRVGMGVLNGSAVYSDVVFVVDSSAALSGVFPSLLKAYILPCIE